MVLYRTGKYLDASLFNFSFLSSLFFPFLSFRSLFFFYICITLYNNYTSSLSLSKMTVLELESDNMKGQILGDILKLLLS